MSAIAVNLTVLFAALVVLVAVGAVRLSVRIGLPGLLVYLAIGMVIGEDGLGVRFDDTSLAQHAGLLALALILTEGGLTTRWVDFRPAVPAAAALATVGVAVSIAVTAVAAHLLLTVPWRTAVILGAVVSSTDAAAVFATLRTLQLPRRLVGILEAESGLNDAPVVIVVAVLSRPSDPGLAMTAQTPARRAGAAVGRCRAAGRSGRRPRNRWHRPPPPRRTTSGRTRGRRRGRGRPRATPRCASARRPPLPPPARWPHRRAARRPWLARSSPARDPRAGTAPQRQ